LPPDVAAILLKNYADLDARDVSGATPLHCASSKGLASFAETLLLHGARVDAPDNRGRTPLHHGCSRGHIGVVEALLRAGAAVTAKDQEGNTALDLAAAKKFSHLCEGISTFCSSFQLLV